MVRGEDKIVVLIDFSLFLVLDGFNILLCHFLFVTILSLYLGNVGLVDCLSSQISSYALPGLDLQSCL